MCECIYVHVFKCMCEYCGVVKVGGIARMIVADKCIDVCVYVHKNIYLYTETCMYLHIV